MSNIVDESLAGTLTEASLAAYLKDDPTAIDTPGGKKGLTPLAAAVSGGNLATVELLLQNHANPDALSKDGRAPLLISTCKKLKANQAAIVSTLLKASAAVDCSSKKHGDNTPLMNAIVQLRDKTIVSELVDHGADVTLKNAKGRSAKDLAKDFGMERALRPRSERSIFQGHFIDLIISVVMFVLSVVDNGAIEGTVKGVISKLYQITGNKNTSDGDKKVFQDLGRKIDSQDNSGKTTGQDLAAHLTTPGPENNQSSATASDSNPSGPTSNSTVSGIQNTSSNSEPNVPESSPEQISLQRLEQTLDDYLDDNDLGKFFPPGDNFLKDIARKAAALASNPNSIYNDPMNIKRLTSLSLYQPVIYCDDSGSMERDNRYENQGQLVDRISRIATKIVPDDCGVDLRFINNGCDKRLSADEVAATIKKVRPTGVTKIGTHLRSKILDPLVYKAIEEGTFKRPVLVCTITDGAPYPEPEDTFKRAIVDCRSKLTEMGYESSAVMFLVSQIGNDPAAQDFLDKLRSDGAISDMLYCTTDKLDDKFKEMKGAEDRLEEWLLKTLTSPIVSFD